ncbi:MAG: type II toxin-antitoxin system RelE/ParE family toxin [Euryarchaeota archaeon]|nr:type II toxin-antitoxin system RelE/ParE family toxin [Euryarchaeota archaeon]
MSWKVRAHPLLKNDLEKLDKHDRLIIRKMIDKIREIPERYKRLKHFTDFYSVRAKNFRVIYFLEENTIFLLIVGSRKRVYKEMKKRMEE